MSGSSSGSSLEDALKMVAAASLAGGVALGRTKTMIRSTMLSAEAPPPIQALGTGLMRVLEGQRGEAATAGLEPDVVPLVQAVLGMIEKAQQEK
jgi:hypothetical protein